MCAYPQSDQPAPREGYVPVENAALYVREIGQGQPVILLHGGPDFDHNYLLPDMDRLLLPRLKRLDIPALVIHSEFDFVPLVCAAHVAQAIPAARFVSLSECGHFSFIECPDEVRKEIDDFLAF